MKSSQKLFIGLDIWPVVINKCHVKLFDSLILSNEANQDSFKKDEDLGDMLPYIDYQVHKLVSFAEFKAHVSANTELEIVQSFY